ncbi:unnamed protein product [Blepharisma stoltei]|uniref:Uncharacterized protein n=1 Tax=Blepharisma stoltei TaxID=1481888 RepID=A0AAU9K7L6_9CILI|nr:unnamed protein product [Blepharisma stoltei]
MLKMSENCDNGFSIFSGMFSLIFKSREGVPSLRLPEIQFFDAKERKSKEKDNDFFNCDSKRPKKMKITACPHVNKRHYARNMCSTCYHRSGRQKQAWACQHKDRRLYAKGVCKTCYLRNYHKAKFSKVKN